MPTHSGPNITDDGLVLSLDAGDPYSYPGSGTTWYDLSGNGNDATIVNSPPWSNTNGGRFEFDGTYDYLNFPEISFTNQDFTLEFWGQIVNFDSRRTIFVKHGIGELSKNYVFFTQLEADGVLIANNFGSAAWPYLVPTGEVFLWDFMFYSDRTATYAVNAQTNPLSVNDYSGVTNLTFKFDGFARNSGRPYYGDLYGLRIYNRALTQPELTRNYNGLKSRFGL